MREKGRKRYLQKDGGGLRGYTNDELYTVIFFYI